MDSSKASSYNASRINIDVNADIHVAIGKPLNAR